MYAVFLFSSIKRREMYESVSRYIRDILLKCNLYVNDIKFVIGSSWLAVESQWFWTTWFYKSKELFTVSITNFLDKNHSLELGVLQLVEKSFVFCINPNGHYRRCPQIPGVWVSFVRCCLKYLCPERGCCATNPKVAGSIPADVIGIFHLYKILPIALWTWGRLSL